MLILSASLLFTLYFFLIQPFLSLVFLFVGLQFSFCQSPLFLHLVFAFSFCSIYLVALGSADVLNIKSLEAIFDLGDHKF